MNTSARPHKVLGVDPTADAKTIRKRYLELVRKHPPERDPRRFAEVRAAYEQLKDPVKELRRRLFPTDMEDTIEAVLADVAEDIRQERFSTEQLFSLGKV